MTIPDKAFLDGAVPVAQAAGIKVVFALYGAKPTTFTGDGGTAEAFAAWAGAGRAHVPVRQDVHRRQRAEPAALLAAAVRRRAASRRRPRRSGRCSPPPTTRSRPSTASNQVAGVGLSPRGNDRPDAPSNVSTSPVRFLKALGDWYRASGRTLPLMDALSFHPYPNANTDPLSSGYAWPSIGLVNADRLKQAIQDAFGGTSQPTVQLRPEALLRRARLAGRHERARPRTPAARTSRSRPRRTRPRSTARFRGSVACDPAISAVNIFGFVDESDRGAGFQAGLVRKDGTPRASLNSFRDGDRGGLQRRQGRVVAGQGRRRRRREVQRLVAEAGQADGVERERDRGRGRACAAGPLQGEEPAAAARRRVDQASARERPTAS